MTRRVLVVGKNSYVGVNLKSWLRSAGYEVDELDVLNGLQPEYLNGYDVIIHVAGIAHKKESEVGLEQYKKVNCDLAVQTALEAKKRHATHFIFFSSMSVYGISTGSISVDTEPCPNTMYGKSKYEAEKEIQKLADDTFIVSILRPPMVYGNKCPGNYSKLASLAVKLPFFPQTNNKRSMIYISTLCNYVQQVIEKKSGGIHFPQNSEYVNTANLVKLIALYRNKKILIVPGMSLITQLISKIPGIPQKVFGSLTYNMDMNRSEIIIDTPEFSETIRLSEE